MAPSKKSEEEKDDRTPEEKAANTKKLLAEAAQAEANARKASAEADSFELELAKKQRVEASELAKDEHARIYVFDKEVSSSSVKELVVKLAEWSRIDPKCNIEIVFNSPGGSVIDGMALFDYITQIRDKGHLVTTSSLGHAASMAGILLQAGDVRKMGRESWLMIHEASFGTYGSTGQVEDMVEWVKAVQEHILKIFAERSNMTVAQLRRKWHRKNWWIDADEALKLGLIDEIA